MNNSMNYYELLGVQRSASNEEIRIAYKNQMKKWHPDINKSESAISMSSKINEAKEVLLDEIKRKDYDEYLDNKVKEDYNRYTQQKAQKEQTTQNHQEYQDNGVTKWQYLKDWLNYGNDSFIRKFIGLLGVLLESFFCTVIKYLLIILAYVTFLLSDLIRELYYYLSIFIFIFIIYTIVLYSTSGYSDFFTNHKAEFNGSITIIIIYVFAYVLPVIGQKLISKEVFNFLYNKLDINLFKICVGYKK